METCRFLRPSVNRACTGKLLPAYARFFSVSRRYLNQPPSRGSSDYEKRVELLSRDRAIQKCWPRLRAAATQQGVDISVSDARQRSQLLDNDATDASTKYNVYGMSGVSVRRRSR